MTPFSIQVQEALAELTGRTKQDIEAETAWKWAARAGAAVRLANASANRLRWIADAVEYGHEAVEHAASAGPELLAEIRARLAAESAALFGGQ